MKCPLLRQHTKTKAGDHGLNRGGDAIVIAVRFKNGIRGHLSGCSIAAHAGTAKMPSCIAGDPTGSIGAGPINRARK
jgi:hypothetical protein